MATLNVNGLTLGYDIIGDTGPSWVLTPGGRFSRDHPGVREVAADLSACGYRVLIWDRPNCGESDVCFEGESESAMQADAMAGLLEALNLAPAIIAGGSAGARISMLTAQRHPDVARGLAIWWVTGGVHGYVVNAYHYCLSSIRAAWVYGMAAVADLPEWKEVTERNPSNRQRILDQDRDAFLATFDRWMRSHLAKDDEIVAGMTKQDGARLTLPSLVVRNHPLDWVHIRSVTDAIAGALPSPTTAEWPPEAHELALEMYELGPSKLFGRWSLLVPMLDVWARESVLNH